MEQTGMLLLYLAVVNIVAFLVYGWDKWLARNNRWRVPEKTLIGLAVAGGSVGALLGMCFWRHKTKHALFMYGLPLILLLQLALAAYLLSNVHL